VRSFKISFGGGLSPTNKDDDDDLKKVKPAKSKTLLVSLLVSIATSQIVYSNIATFLPPYRSDKHPGLNDTSVGIILA